ncbi:IS4 family transposase [Haloactinomyces albus]|uniref:IS4 family transposase n=1 Tax=Haloactinomyces albus TaxID=1352928 RepID=A0AAE3ZGX0_9ACTN|nr:IS4 family transposase [Haloactinomyces albus]MDR7304652.1 hypothetical protein [Haloactinomyces albus]
MPRPGQVTSSSRERLPDRIAIGVLTRAFPPELVDEVLAATGRVEQRKRLLPARVVVYFVLAMCLFRQEGYEEVTRLLTNGLAWTRHWQTQWQAPTTAALSRARARLGAEPVAALFERVATPVATAATAGAWYRGHRLVAVDGTTFDLADTPANGDYFGRPGSSRGDGVSAYPQARVVALAECGTHAIFAATSAPLTTTESKLVPKLWPALAPDMLLLADRALLSFGAWRAATATGADLLWRARSSAVLPVTRQFDDGSYLSEIVAARDKNRRADPATVRVVEFTLGEAATVYRLVTSLLDPEQAPAAELAALYAQRWEIETALDELKTHQGGPNLILRSQHPDGVEQELYGFLLTHHALRGLMHDTAASAETDPDRISFLRTLRVVRRQVTDQAAFSPEPPDASTTVHP